MPAVVIALLVVYGGIVFICATQMMNEGRVHSWFYGYALARHVLAYARFAYML